MQKPVLGHIDCPTCGASKAMRITHDKNGDPFGFCEDNCGQQLRVGGNPRRVRDFVKRFPWAAKSPVTVTVPLQEPKPAEKPVPVPAAAPEPKPAPAAKPVSVPAKPAPAAKPVPVPKPAEQKPEPAKKSGWLTPLIGS